MDPDSRCRYAATNVVINRTKGVAGGEGVYVEPTDPIGYDDARAVRRHICACAVSTSTVSRLPKFERCACVHEAVEGEGADPRPRLGIKKAVTYI